MAEERTAERTVEEAPFPPYFVEFIEERDKRLLAELRQVETRVQHNAERIDELRQEMERRFTEAKEDRQAIRQEAREDRQAIRQEARDDRQAIRQEMRQGFTEARDDRRAMREEIKHLRDDMSSHFRWTIGIMIPIVLGILAIIVRVFFFGFGPTP